MAFFAGLDGGQFFNNENTNNGDKMETSNGEALTAGLEGGFIIDSGARMKVKRDILHRSIIQFERGNCQPIYYFKKVIKSRNKMSQYVPHLYG